METPAAGGCEGTGHGSGSDRTDVRHSGSNRRIENDVVGNTGTVLESHGSSGGHSELGGIEARSSHAHRVRSAGRWSRRRRRGWWWWRWWIDDAVTAAAAARERNRERNYKPQITKLPHQHPPGSGLAPPRRYTH